MSKITTRNYTFFQNRQCEYFPCHEGIAEEDFNCLFCYCPLYMLGKQCGGNFTRTESGLKSCMHCTYPHHRENYDSIIDRYGEIASAVAWFDHEETH
jgi:Zn-finger protein